LCVSERREESKRERARERARELVPKQKYSTPFASHYHSIEVLQYYIVLLCSIDKLMNKSIFVLNISHQMNKNLSILINNKSEKSEIFDWTAINK